MLSSLERINQRTAKPKQPAEPKSAQAPPPPPPPKPSASPTPPIAQSPPIPPAPKPPAPKPPAPKPPAPKPPAPKPPAPPVEPRKIIIHGQGELVRACQEISELYRSGNLLENTPQIEMRVNAIYDYLGYPQTRKDRKNYSLVKANFAALSAADQKKIRDHRNLVNVAAISGLLNSINDANLDQNIREQHPFQVASSILDLASIMTREAPHSLVIKRFTGGGDPLIAILQGVISATNPAKRQDLTGMHSTAIGLMDRLVRKEKDALTAPEILEQLRSATPPGIDVRIRVSSVYTWEASSQETAVRKPPAAARGPARMVSRQKTPGLGGGGES